MAAEMIVAQMHASEEIVLRKLEEEGNLLVEFSSLWKLLVYLLAVRVVVLVVLLGSVVHQGAQHP